MDTTGDYGERPVPGRDVPGRKPPAQPVHRLAWLGEDVRGRELPPARFEGSIPFPPALLERHGAVVLRPAVVTLVAGRPVPRSTAYRAGVLLVREGTAQDDAFFGRANTALQDLGVSLVKPPPIAVDERLQRYRERLNDLPRPVRIAVNEDAGPRRVDAWPVLQTLRASGTLASVGSASVGLDHLLVGSAMVSIGGSPGAVEGSPGAVEGSPGPAVYLKPGTGGRVPVAVALAPPRPSPTCLRRRPVMAVLDTGITDPPHPWLAGVVRTDPVVQAAVQAAGEAAQAAGPGPGKVITGPLDTPFDDLDFVQDIDTHAGHGTFIAGVVRQVAPDALVTAIRGTRPDPVDLGPEHFEVLRLCRLPASVADLAADLNLPVGVVRILISDLRDRSLIRIHHPVSPARLPDPRILREVVDGLRRL